jgi:predicted AlkP superfamily phosphohydrolase/phosphomutase
MKASRRIAVVGIDGFAPRDIERFMSSGTMPNLSRLCRRGATAPLISTLPATTPVAWASIVTGCHPSRTGIEGFLLHREGDRLDQRVSGTYTTRCRAEPVWETVTLAGKSSYVLKFPLSYPSSTASLRIDGAAGWGGLTCLHEVVSARVTDSDRDQGDGDRLFVDVDPWKGTPSAETAWQMRLQLKAVWSDEPVILWLALTRSPPWTLFIARAADWREVLGQISVDEWSEPLRIRAVGRTGEAECAFRLRMLDFALQRPRLRLLNTAFHETTGHSHPEHRAARLLAAAGPIEEQTDPSLCLAGDIDLSTQLERCRLNVDWLKRASRFVLSEEQWDLFLVHVHFVDWAHHMLEGAVDPRHPLHAPEQAREAGELLRKHYELVDELVGVVAESLGPEDDVVVLGDHGQDLHHTTVRINELLARDGYLRWEAGSGTGERVDWTQTRAYAAGNYLYLNIIGREPTGIVPANDLETVVDELIAWLLSLQDPRGHARPVLIAGPKAHFAMLGADGPGVGDIVFCLSSGYQARNDRGACFELTRPLREFTSGHDHFWPADPRIETRLFAAGPSFQEGLQGERRSVIDVAPTLCAVLGIDPPLGCQGRVMSDILRPDVCQAAQATSVDVEWGRRERA